MGTAITVILWLLAGVLGLAFFIAAVCVFVLSWVMIREAISR